MENKVLFRSLNKMNVEVSVLPIALFMQLFCSCTVSILHYLSILFHYKFLFICLNILLYNDPDHRIKAWSTNFTSYLLTQTKDPTIAALAQSVLTRIPILNSRKFLFFRAQEWKGHFAPSSRLPSDYGFKMNGFEWCIQKL